MRVPLSKSFAHRVLMADYLSGGTLFRTLSDDGLCDDLIATRRCLAAMADHAESSGELRLDCGESGTTRRLLSPIVSALRMNPVWEMKGRLASRPQLDIPDVSPGVQTLPGHLSSQFVSGLLLALAVFRERSEIRLSTPLSSRGYVDMTCDVLATYGVHVESSERGFVIPKGGYVKPAETPLLERDWSGAAFLLAMKALGNDVGFSDEGLSALSRQPDRVAPEKLAALASGRGLVSLDVDECPDLFPILSLVAAAQAHPTRFTGTRRLRLKESDRVEAMRDVLTRFGATVEVEEDSFTVVPSGRPFRGGAFSASDDHRIAMTIAVGATCADGVVVLDNETCAAKSYPTFFEDFCSLAVIPPSARTT